MTEQQKTDFDRWFEQRMDPELNLTPGDKELCRHAWQAAPSHAEGEAQPVAWGLKWPEDVGVNPHTVFRSEAHAQAYRAGCQSADTIMVVPLYTHPAPQVAVPEGWQIKQQEDGVTVLWPDNRGGVYVKTDCPYNRIAEDVLHDLAMAMLAAAPTAPAGELVTRCTAGLGCDEKGHCDAAATGQGDMCDRRTMAHEQPVSDPDGLGAERARRLETATVAKLLLNAWAESEPDHPVTKHPASYAETFTDMAKAMMPLMAAPDEREIAARALDKVAKELALRAIPGGVDDALERSFCVNTLRAEAERLRAGKEGE